MENSSNLGELVHQKPELELLDAGGIQNNRSGGEVFASEAG